MPGSVILLSMEIEIESLLQTDQIFPLSLTDKFNCLESIQSTWKKKSQGLLIHGDIRHVDNPNILEN